MPQELWVQQNSTMHFSQTGKEALGITSASEPFADYFIGLKFHINVNHKPLVPFLSSKNLDELPARVQRFWMCMMWFSYSISQVNGKNLYTTETLSRAPHVKPLNQHEEKLESDVKAYICWLGHQIPDATEDRLDELRCHNRKVKLPSRSWSFPWPNGLRDLDFLDCWDHTGQGEMIWQYNKAYWWRAILLLCLCACN